MTLLEIMLALLLSGGLIVAGAMMLDQVNDSGARIVAERSWSAREGNGIRLLRRLLAEAQPPADSVERFRGDERSLGTRTTCATARGWLIRCHVQVAIDWLRDSSVVVFDTEGDRLSLVRLPGRRQFRYFDPSNQDSLWVHEWTSIATIPMALAIVSTTDTIVFSIGPGRD